MFIEINYTEFPSVNPISKKIEDIIYRPFIPVRLGNKHSFSQFKVNCLLDSGSDRNLFPAQWGETVGLKIKKGKMIPVKGIGGNDVTAYRHLIKLFVNTYGFNTVADFSYEQNVPLLGREGFFDQFKTVLFNEEEKRIELGY